MEIKSKYLRHVDSLRAATVLMIICYPKFYFVDRPKTDLRQLHWMVIELFDNSWQV